VDASHTKVLLPILTNPRSQRLETETVPGLLKQIYDAEMIYKARQPDGNFACDGTLLPGTAGKLNWQHGNSAEVRKYLTVDYYEISLDCPNANTPRSFRVTARSKDGYILAPNLSTQHRHRNSGLSQPSCRPFYRYRLLVGGRPARSLCARLSCDLVSRHFCHHFSWRP
jgi:hypothetical protein